MMKNHDNMFCPEQVLADVRKIVGNDYATADLDKMLCYLVDESYPLIRPKETQNCILVRPACAKEVSKIPLQRKHKAGLHRHRAAHNAGPAAARDHRDPVFIDEPDH